MASSDTTGYHENGWRFHQFSSSGNVLRGTSGCQLEMTDGVAATLSTGATLTLNGSVNLTKGTMTLDSSGTIVKPPQVLATTGGTILNNGVCVLTCSSSETDYVLQPPVNGSRLDIILHGASSQLTKIASSSGKADIGFRAAGGTSGDRLITSSSNPHRVPARGTIKIELSATGTGHWRILNSQYQADLSTEAAVIAWALTTN